MPLSLTSMDNSDVLLFNYVIHDISMQQQYLPYIQDKISILSGSQCHMFPETLQYLGLLKSHLQLRREWLQRQNGSENIFVDLNWCSACDQSECRLE